MSTATNLDRRACLTLLATSLGSQTLQAQEPAPESALAAALRTKTWSSQGIQMEVPPLADTGNAVPLSLQIEAPPGLSIEQVEVLLPENPNPVALTLQWPQARSRVKLQTRLRLAGTQSVWVIARYSDGSERARSAPTIITSTACLDGT
jgi:sulfur-oxidizing protein SoxY